MNHKIPEEYQGGERELDINEDDYWMMIARIASLRSPDPSTQVGAVYVSDTGQFISLGYNQPPKSWNYLKFPFGTSSSRSYQTKYPYIIHAEVDALKGMDYTNSTCYVTLFPCSNCAKQMIHRGVKRVVYLDYRMNDYIKDDVQAVFTMFNECGVECVSYRDIRDIDGVEINFKDVTEDNVKILKRTRNNDGQ